MRPILSSIGSYNHECAAWLSEIFTPLRHHQATVKDSFEFLHRTSDLSVSDKIMPSLDIKSLFANVPVNFTIDLVLISVFFNNITEFHSLTKFQLKELLHRTSKAQYFSLTDSCLSKLMEFLWETQSRSALLLADVCMNWALD